MKEIKITLKDAKDMEEFVKINARASVRFTSVHIYNITLHYICHLYSNKKEQQGFIPCHSYYAYYY